VGAEACTDVAGFESIFDSQSIAESQGQFVDSWDDCYDCNYNCQECDSRG